MDSKSLFEFLGSDVKKVEIPRLQRDYAQGRDTAGAKEVREGFTTELWKVITGEKTSLTLDLIYGYDEDGCFIPIDGQQRLTTLWLLHWYIAFRCGEFKEKSDESAEREEDTKKRLRKFTYETRVSSREFLSMLCDMAKFLEDNQNPDQSGEADEQNEESGKLSTCIKNQTWFRSSWIQDPTIKSMLTMIDRFDELWGQKGTKNNEWGTLRSRLNNIKFYFANMREWKLGDDLYIKMNARGLLLTDYEKFKAALQKHQKDKKYGNSDEFNNWLDGGFLDFFWNIAKESRDANETPAPDRLMMEFVNRYVITARILAIQSGANNDDNTEENSNNTKERRPEDYDIVGEFPSLYTSFSPYQELNKDRWDGLKVFFHFIEVARELASARKEELPWNPYWEAEGKYSDYLIPRYENEKGISLKDRCILAALYLFVFNKTGGKTVECDEWIDDPNYEKALKDWMHICWNIVENVNTSGYGEMYQCIELLHALAKEVLYDELNIYRNLAAVSLEQEHQPTPERPVDKLKSVAHIVSGRPLQRRVLREEIEKAKEFRNYPTIIEAEKRFRGSISFLFASSYSRETGYSLCWSNFIDKWDSLQGENGLLRSVPRKERKKLWSHFCFELIKHLKQENDWMLYDKQIFDSAKEGIEKDILTNSDLLPTVHALLTDKACLSDQDEGQRAEESSSPKDLLCHREIISYAVNSEPTARLHWYYDHLCLYKPYPGNKEGVVLGLEAAARADSLITLMRKNKVSLVGKWGQDGLTSYLRGWDIPFNVGDVRYMWTLYSALRIYGDWSQKEDEVHFSHDRYRGIKLKVESSILGVIQPLLEDVGWVREGSASPSNTSQS